MRVLLVYAGKHGTAKSCIDRLMHELHGGNTVDAVDLSQMDVDPGEYDLVVFGSSIYFGKMRPEAKRFLERNTETLMKKPLGLFLVCGLTSEYEYYREKLFSQRLRDHAFLTMYFGGSLSTEGLSFLEKQLVKAMRAAIFEENMEDGEYTPTLPSILPENIDRMATYIRREIEQLSEAKD